MGWAGRGLSRLCNLCAGGVAGAVLERTSLWPGYLFRCRDSSHLPYTFGIRDPLWHHEPGAWAASYSAAGHLLHRMDAIAPAHAIRMDSGHQLPSHLHRIRNFHWADHASFALP